MGSILWVPMAFTMSASFLYLLSRNLPEHTGSDRSALKFPSNFEDLTALASLLQDYKSDNLEYVMLLYCSAYLFKQTFAIPGSFLMNLLGGALFGTWLSFPLVCLLTASGATCCYVLSQFFGKSYIVKFFPDKVHFMQKKVIDNRDSLFFFSVVPEIISNVTKLVFKHGVSNIGCSCTYVFCVSIYRFDAL